MIFLKSYLIRYVNWLTNRYFNLKSKIKISLIRYSIRSSIPKREKFAAKIRLENFASKILTRCWAIWRSRKRRKTSLTTTDSLTPATSSSTTNTATSSTSTEWKNSSSTLTFYIRKNWIFTKMRICVIGWRKVRSKVRIRGVPID